MLLKKNLKWLRAYFLQELEPESEPAKKNAGVDELYLTSCGAEPLACSPTRCDTAARLLSISASSTLILLAAWPRLLARSAYRSGAEHPTGQPSNS